MNAEFLPKDGIVLCAVSGGADSMFLLERLRDMGFSVAAAHFHHGLRGAEADGDEAFVRAFCAERAISFTAGRGDTAAYAREHCLGVEEAARRLRYAFLESAADELGAAVIATAHTADDNIETVLLHLTRGAGLRGLGGIPPVRGRIVRPMLDTSRAEVEAYLCAKGITWREDATNAADDFARNRLRHSVVPALRAENPALGAAIGRMTELLRRDEEYLAGLAAAFVAEHAADGSVSASALCALPWPVASRAVRRMAGVELSAEHTAAILRAAEQGGTADVSGLRVAVSGGRLYFGVRETRPFAPREIEPGRRIELPEAGLCVRCEKIDAAPTDVYKSLTTFFFSCANIYGKITVTPRRAGDRLRPVGRGCTKTLKALFQEQAVPPWARDAVPVLRDEKGILAVYGIGVSERACAAPNERGAIQIEITRLPPGQGG